MSVPAQKLPTSYQIAMGAVSDVQKLLKRAAGFANTDAKRISIEIRESFRMAAGAWAALSVGGTLFGIGFVHALGALAPELPMWAGYLLAGSAVLLVGIVLYSSAAAKLDSLESFREHAAEVATDAVLIADQVNEAVISTKESIQSGVDSVRSTVESIRHAADIKYQVEHRPWTMFITATGLGFIGGTLLSSLPNGTTVRSVYSPNGSKKAPEAGPSGVGIAFESVLAPEEPGFIAKLGEVLAPQAHLARELAIGALFSLARDFAHDAVAKPMAQPLDDFFNDAARKFGGKPLAPGTLSSFKTGAVAEESRPAQ